MRTELALFELDDEPGWTGPRLLGRTTDQDLIDQVRERITAARRRELARLESPVRLVAAAALEPGSE